MMRTYEYYVYIVPVIGQNGECYWVESETPEQKAPRGTVRYPFILHW